MRNSKSIVAILLVMLFILSSVACGAKKTPATIDAFNEKAAAVNCDKIEMTIEDENVKSLVKSSSFAAKLDGDSVMICEFYEATSELAAKQLYSGTKAAAEELVTGNKSQLSKEISNYASYRVSDNEIICYLARIDNTILYIRASKIFSPDVESLVKSLGY